MISEEQFEKELELIIANAIREDVGEGDHTSLSCIPADAKGKAKLLVKDEGVIAGVEFAKKVWTDIRIRVPSRVLNFSSCLVSGRSTSSYRELLLHTGT